jgi:hypothetical protein
VYRVKTIYRNRGSDPIIERGPWHESRKDAEYWAEQLRFAGYAVSIESQNIKSEGVSDNSDLAAALASMA